MTLYTVTAYRDEGTGQGSVKSEYDVTTRQDETAGDAVFVPREREIELRLLEAVCANLAQLAESADRIARALEQVGRFQAGY